MRLRRPTPVRQKLSSHPPPDSSSVQIHSMRPSSCTEFKGSRSVRSSGLTDGLAYSEDAQNRHLPRRRSVRRSQRAGLPRCSRRGRHRCSTLVSPLRAGNAAVTLLVGIAAHARRIAVVILTIILAVTRWVVYPQPSNPVIAR
jgi:hypothetical protein